MQLKVTEPEVTEEEKQETVPDGTVSNNDYFNPELEFDYEGGLFDEPRTFDNPMGTPSSVNPSGTNPAGQSPSGGEYYGTTGETPGYRGSTPTYGNGAGGSNDYYAQSSGSTNNDNPMPGAGERPRKLSKKEFFDSPRNRRDRDRIIISSIVVIVTAIFDVIRTDFWLTTFQSQINFVNNMTEELGMGAQYQIDTKGIMTTQITLSVILVCLGLGIFILKSRVCAIVGLAITGINLIATLIHFGQFRMYWALIAFGYATLATISFASKWKDYEQNGDWKKSWTY